MKCAGCDKQLTGRQSKWHSDDCKNAFNTEVRRRALGKGLSALLPGNGNGRVHSGHPSRSRRLAKLLNLFIDSKGRRITTLDIHEATGSMKSSGDVDDLRRAGYPVSMARYVRTTDEGRRVYDYKWDGK